MASQDEEPEPQLKYELLGGDVQNILGNEKITCMNVSEKILAIGTGQGRVHVLDYSGNQVRLLNVHKSRVNDISFDKEAEHIASASNDCSVVVTNLYTDQTTRHEFRSPIKAVAIDPRPAISVRKTWRDLITGTASGEVTLHTQGWLARSDQPLGAASSRDVAAGGVLAAKWSGNLVAWAYDSCVSVYDTTSHQLIRTLRRHDLRAAAAGGAAQPPRSPPPSYHNPADRPISSAAAAAPSPATASATTPATEAPRGSTAATAIYPSIGAEGGSSIGSLHRCSLLFAPDSHLYVAWSDTVLVARIWSYENNMGSLWPQVELVARMKLGEAVLGVSPYGDSDLAVLVYPSGVSPVPSNHRAQTLSQETEVQPQPQPQPKKGQAGKDGRQEDSTQNRSSPQQQQQQIEPQQQGEQEQQLQSEADPYERQSISSSGCSEGNGSGAVSATQDTSATGLSDDRIAGDRQVGEERGSDLTGTAAPAEGSDGVAVKGAPPPPSPPPDPLAPGRTPQLVILGRSDHREWARDSVPLTGAEKSGPEDYLGLMPSLPHHLHLPATATTTTTVAAAMAATIDAAAAAAASASTLGAVFSGRAGIAAATTAAAPASMAPSRTSRDSGGGGAGSPSAATPASSLPSTPASAASKAASSGPGAATAAPAAPAAPRRLVPVWVDGQELIFFIAAPMAIASARSRDASDRISWLLARRRWEEALSVVEEAPQGLPPGLYDRVVDGYIEELLTTQSYDKAVELSERLLKDDAKRWERWVYLFAQARQLPKLVGRLPTQKPRLRSHVYDVALQSLFPNTADHPTLVMLAHTWPSGCYSLATLADAVAGWLRRLQLQQPHQPSNSAAMASPAAPAYVSVVSGGGAAVASSATDAGSGSGFDGDSGGGSSGYPLWQLLAWLYEQQGRPDLALSIHLRLKSPAVFNFVNHHGLQANLLGRAPDLFEVDEKAALALLTSHVDALPATNVVPSLQEAMRSAPSTADSEVWRRRLFSYLQTLFAVDSSVGADYHDLQVSLTAEYQPSKLMDLLVSSQYYSLEAAHAICEARGLVSEQVFVLGRMGNVDQALRLIIDELGDIPRAIDFVVGQRDDELWGRLIGWALGTPETTGALLDCIGGYVDPLLLVRRIPRGMRVERLRDRLRAIIADYRTQTSLREGCNAILRSDCRHLLSKLYDGTRRALPYLYVMRPDGNVEGGRWYRCDVVHGGKLQAVSSGEVPEEIFLLGSSQGGPGGYTRPMGHPPGPGPGPGSVPGLGGGRGKSSGSPVSASSFPSAAGAASSLHTEHNRLHNNSIRLLSPNSNRNSSSATNVLASVASAPASVSSAATAAERKGMIRTHGSSAAAALDRSLAAGGNRGDTAAGSAIEGLPWWALSGGAMDGTSVIRGSWSSAATATEPWVGFNPASVKARLGPVEDTLEGFGGGGGGGGRRARDGR